MKRILCSLVVLLAACSSSTAPKAGVDPSVLVTNWSDDSAYVTWSSDAGLATVAIAPHAQNVCTRWTQSFDSLYVQVRAGGAMVTAPWVHFSQYPEYFQVDNVYAITNSPSPGPPATI